MKRLIALLTLVPALLSAAERPNLVFLLADDQSFYSMGCYGNEDVQTPNLDRLSADGVTFDAHYDTTSICMASRANIFTGLYEFRTGCNFGRGDLPADLWERSYPMLLRKAGYRTAFAGKYGVMVEGKGLPEEDFDGWGGGPGQTHYATAKNKSMARYAKEFPHATRAYGAFGRDFIAESAKRGKPFSLSISFKAPHRPVSPDPIDDQVYAGKTFKKPANYGREHGAHFSEQSRQGRQYTRFHEWGYSDKYDEVMAKYHQQIYAVDAAVGMVREALEKHGVADNTVIIYTSDNGFLCGSHGYGSKVLPYEEASRVPLIIYDPRHVSAGKQLRCAAVTGNIDFAPTMLELAGVEVPEGLDGKSLLPLLDDPKTDIRESLALMNFWGPTETHSFGMVSRDWKYLYWFYEGKGMKPTEELFNLGADRLELSNAINDPNAASALDRMRKAYDAEVQRIGSEGRRASYRGYGALFDRKLDAAEKAKQVKQVSPDPPKPKKPKKPKKNRQQ